MARAFIVETPFGVFGLDQENKILTKRLFDTDVNKTVEKLVNLQNGEIIPELREIIDELSQQDYNEIILEDSRLASNLKNEEIVIESPSTAGRILRSKLIFFIQEFSIWKNKEEIFQYIQQINILLTRRKIKNISEQKDRFIAQAIEAVDDCDKSLNLFSSRIREWFGLHFPELDKNLSSHTSFVKIVGKIGARDDIVSQNLEKIIGFPFEKAEEIAKLAKESMGGSITDFELKPLQDFALNTEELYKTRDKLAIYIDEAMQQVAPNIRALVGALLGARLISLAGNLERLARMPSSTIQVLGAEKALFRALRTGAKPPKHGIIFQWEDIHGAPYWLKGKIARALAGKLTIAARVDHYSGEYIGDNLLIDLNRRINDIKKKYSTPPKKPKKEKTTVIEKKKPYKKKSKRYNKKRKKDRRKKSKK
ncbi:MAG: C/D box methylation guide ribonucleoprotein complex aNOP56 subunit [Promethearchaeota archaeon]